MKIKYQNKHQMGKYTVEFLCYYNLYRRRGSLRKEPNVKTPFQAVEKGYKIEPELFKTTPNEFKNKILNLKFDFNQLPSTTL